MLFERIKLDDDEQLLRVIRKHWWIIFIQTFGVVFLAMLPYTMLVSLLVFEPFGFTTIYETINDYLSLYRPEIYFCYLLWLLILWIMLANHWTDHYLDLWAITSQRVVLVDQRGFFRRFISSFRLERLQDMNIEVNGIIATLLDYGTIEAQTAGGSNEEFISKFMPRPRDIKALIIEAADLRMKAIHLENRQQLEGL